MRHSNWTRLAAGTIGAALLITGATRAANSNAEGVYCVEVTADITNPIPLGSLVTFTAVGSPGGLLVLGIDTDPGPTTIPLNGGLTVNLGLSSMFESATLALGANGMTSFSCVVDCEDTSLIGIPLYIQGIQFMPRVPGSACLSNPLTVVFDGNCCTGTAGDFVWQDLNSNALQDPGEPGIPGVMLTLCDGNGNELESTFTDANGAYGFDEMCAGDYTIKIDYATVPPTLGPVLCMQGMDDTVDSNCAPSSFNLPTDDSDDPTHDFGFDNCGECDGKATYLQFRYLGAMAAQIDVDAKNNIFSAVVQPGEVFAVFGDDNGTLGKEIDIYEDMVLTEQIHTSCSQPLYPTQIIGNFEIVGGASEDGGVFCVPNDVCSIGGKPQTLTMAYTGEDCSSSNNTQDPSKAVCSGDPAFANPVFITAGEDQGESQYFSGMVNLGDCFVIDATLSGETKLNSATFVDIYDATGTTLLQSLEFHTSCSQPLFIGNQFGSLKLKAFTLE